MSALQLLESFSANEPDTGVGKNTFERAMIEGLHAARKNIPSKFFYDERGSALFDQICELPEYYPTRTETNLLRGYANQMAQLIGPDATLVEYGAGSLKKVGYLIDALRSARRYIPVDISGEYLNGVVRRFQRLYPQLKVNPVVADFTRKFDLPSDTAQERLIGFFPGSTIGNLDKAEAVGFLKRAANQLRGGGLLIGVDLVKDPALLHAAYNDSVGVTEAFNKNLLVRANRELHADFDLSRFSHYAFYNPALKRIEMHLMSLSNQWASFAGTSVSFSEGETIHTENSQKYTIGEFQELARMAGFAPRAAWTDPLHLFSIHWLESAGGPGF